MITTNRPEQLGLRGGYEKRDFGKGPKTYSDTSFADKIAFVLGINSLAQKAIALDLMSGPGKLSADLQAKRPDVNFIALDWTHNQLLKASTPLKVQADAKHLPIVPNSVDAIFARYAIKDLTTQDQILAIQQAAEALKPGGVFVLAEMITPNPQTKNWLNMQHAQKQEFSGRNPEKEGICNIETFRGWRKILEQAGLTITLARRYLSIVETTDWLKGNQVTEQQLEELNHIILTAPEAAKRAFNIREENGSVKIDYPVTIIRAVKP